MHHTSLEILNCVYTMEVDTNATLLVSAEEQIKTLVCGCQSMNMLNASYTLQCRQLMECS